MESSGCTWTTRPRRAAFARLDGSRAKPVSESIARYRVTNPLTPMCWGQLGRFGVFAPVLGCFSEKMIVFLLVSKELNCYTQGQRHRHYSLLSGAKQVRHSHAVC